MMVRVLLPGRPFGLLVALMLVATMPWTVGSLAVAADEIVLWPEGVPEPRVPADPPEKVEVRDGISRRSNVSSPRLVVYALLRTDSAATPRTAVIVVPGGGFSILADEHEGSDVCRWLAEQGMMAFLLLHRAPTNKHEQPNAGPVLDTQKAVYEVRRRAADFGIDPKRVVVLGFSAGGQTSLVAATNSPRFEPADKTISTRPDALMLIYAWKIVGADNKGLRPDVTIDAATPPVFIAQSGNDTGSVPQGSVNLYLACLEAKVPAELHIYEAGGHGFGMQKRDKAPGTSDWPNRGLEWLRSRGF
jgi:acetyl esterase/lipase